MFDQRESTQEREAWLDAIARDDRRDHVEAKEVLHAGAGRSGADSQRGILAGLAGELRGSLAPAERLAESDHAGTKEKRR